MTYEQQFGYSFIFSKQRPSCRKMYRLLANRSRSLTTRISQGTVRNAESRSESLLLANISVHHLPYEFPVPPHRKLEAHVIPPPLVQASMRAPG